jgi:hypothetical protein
MEIGATRPRGAWIAIIETGVCWKGIVRTMAVSVRSVFVASCNHTGLLKAAILAFLFVLPLLGTPAAAPTTTISGTVYDARTTASSLPLPSVLVYVTTGTVDPLPAGVQCLTASTPTGVVSYTTTAVDGTFTLGDVPQNATYTLVIQAGKWRRQFSETVAAVPLTGLALHMPADHTQGDIPKIAIATGSVDALECVFLAVWALTQSEFTDDNGTTGGRIHLYKGDNSPGAKINASTPIGNCAHGNAHGFLAPRQLRHGDVSLPGRRARSIHHRT